MQIYKSWRNSAMVVVDLLSHVSKIKVGLILLLLLFCGESVGDNEKWVPYSTVEHSLKGRDFGFQRRLFLYLSNDRNLKDPELTHTYNRWYRINLGYIFEEASLKAYGVPKNESFFNGRIPDGVEDGFLDQMAQYTHYPNSTFIEVKYMKELSFTDDRIRKQIKDMINYLSIQETHSTTQRLDILSPPGKASEEELAILVFLTPSNCVISQEIIEYGQNRKVKIYQQKMQYNLFNPMQIMFSKPLPLTEPSRHLHAHTFSQKKVIINWNNPIINPDTKKPISGY